MRQVDDNHLSHHGYRNDTIKSYAAIVYKIAHKNKLSFVDLEGIITIGNLKSDGLHPDAAGHEKIFQKIREVIPEAQLHSRR